jgi:uncharacterized protein YciI
MKAILLLALMLAGAPALAQPEPAPAAPRQLYLFLYRPGPAWRAGRPMREQDLRAHGAYHARLVREGRSVAGGGYVGEDGGMAIVRAASPDEARAMLAADPAIVNGVFVAELRQWAPRFHSEAPLVERPRRAIRSAW